MDILGWHTILFLIPIGVGITLAIGAALGVDGSGDGHGDSGAGHGHDGDGPHPAAGHAPPDLATTNPLPWSLRLMLASLSFGGIGLCLSYLLTAGDLQTGSSEARTLVAAGLAAAATAVITRRTARLFARRMPLLESETVTRQELVGSTGRAVLPVGPAGGVVQVRDRRGNLHQLSCRTLHGEPTLPLGSDVLLVEYDGHRGVYRATANPLQAPR